MRLGDLWAQMIMTRVLAPKVMQDKQDGRFQKWRVHLMTLKMDDGHIVILPDDGLPSDAGGNDS